MAEWDQAAGRFRTAAEEAVIEMNRRQRDQRPSGSGGGGAAGGGCISGVVVLVVIGWICVKACSGGSKGTKSETNTQKAPATEAVAPQIATPLPTTDPAAWKTRGENAQRYCTEIGSSKLCKDSFVGGLKTLADAYKNASPSKHTDIYNAAREYETGFLTAIPKGMMTGWEGTLDSLSLTGNHLDWAYVMISADGYNVKLHATSQKTLKVDRRLAQGACVRFAGVIAPTENSISKSGAMDMPEHNLEASRLEACSAPRPRKQVKAKKAEDSENE